MGQLKKSKKMIIRKEKRKLVMRRIGGYMWEQEEGREWKWCRTLLPQSVVTVVILKHNMNLNTLHSYTLTKDVAKVPGNEHWGSA